MFRLGWTLTIHSGFSTRFFDMRLGLIKSLFYFSFSSSYFGSFELLRNSLNGSKFVLADRHLSFSNSRLSFTTSWRFSDTFELFQFIWAFKTRLNFYAQCQLFQIIWDEILRFARTLVSLVWVYWLVLAFNFELFKAIWASTTHLNFYETRLIFHTRLSFIKSFELFRLVWAFTNLTRASTICLEFSTSSSFCEAFGFLRPVGSSTNR